MKKLSILGLLLLFFITSCKTPVYSLGMSEDEFTAHYKRSTDLVEKSAQRTVYRRTSSSFIPKPTYYYYFVDGKLVRIDEGERKPYVIVEHTNN
ncbi:MAG: hypothetical protein JWR38_1269 [Mucilaginibacter sp.]|nr:hypothetical protein [Mucilaginibacter sp.]